MALSYWPVQNIRHKASWYLWPCLPSPHPGLPSLAYPAGWVRKAGGWPMSLPVFGAWFLPCPISPAVFWREECALCPEQTLTQTSWVGRQLGEKKWEPPSPSDQGSWQLCGLCVCVCVPRATEFSTREFSNQREHGEKVTELGLTTRAPLEESSRPRTSLSVSPLDCKGR